jgi:hypothetical protein
MCYHTWLLPSSNTAFFTWLQDLAVCGASSCCCLQSSTLGWLFLLLLFCKSCLYPTAFQAVSHIHLSGHPPRLCLTGSSSLVTRPKTASLPHLSKRHYYFPESQTKDKDVICELSVPGPLLQPTTRSHPHFKSKLKSQATFQGHCCPVTWGTLPLPTPVSAQGFFLLPPEQPVV